MELSCTNLTSQECFVKHLRQQNEKEKDDGLIPQAQAKRVHKIVLALPHPLLRKFIPGLEPVQKKSPCKKFNVVVHIYNP